MTATALDETRVPQNLPVVETPLVAASNESLAGYGYLVDDFASAEIEIVRWPALGRRPVDPDTGDQGGTTEGIFEFWWEGSVMRGRNNAVDDQYVLGWSADGAAPDWARATGSAMKGGDGPQILLRHANYHPDGGQLFFSTDGTPFVTPLALPGDDVTPGDFVTFYCDGSKGLYIHPGIWHEAVFPIAERANFHDRQGRVHARVSVDFDNEFGIYLSVPLRRP